MDYFVGFLLGYWIKEIIIFIKELSYRNFEIIEYDFDEEWED